MKNKVYISLPITDHEDDVHIRNLQAKKYIEKKFKGYVSVSPLDCNKIDEAAFETHTQLSKTAYYMGKDIEQVILCDAILMCPGWLYSKGCQVELYTAKIYGKDIFFMP